MVEYNSNVNEYKSSYNSSSNELYKPAKTGPVCRRTCCTPPYFECSCGRN